MQAPHFTIRACTMHFTQVFPFAGVAEAVAPGVPRLLLNRTLVGGFGSRQGDRAMLGDLVDCVWKLAEELGWTKELKELCDSGQK